MADLSALIERVEKLTGPDPEMDALIAAHFHVKLIRGTWPSWCIDPPFTASLDAAVALVERVLPGWGISLSIGIKSFSAGVWKPGELDQRYSSHHPLVPIAMILAALRALQAQEGRDG